MPALLALALLGCARGPAPVAAADAPAPDAPSLDAFFDATWQAHLDDTPVMRTFLGIGDDHSTWGDLSDQGALDRIAKAEANCTTLRSTFDPATLAPDEALSYRLFLHDCEGQISDRPWVQHNYPVNPIGGQHTWFATFLMGVQPLTEPDDIDDWIARLADVDTQLDVLIQQLKDREALGVMPPAFAFGPSIRAAENLLTGAPFEGPGDSPLLETFRRKLSEMEGLDADPQAAHEAEVARVLLEEVGPAYRRVIDVLADQSSRATEDAGAWKLPDGEAYYRHRLARTTTTDLDPEAIHALGLAEVERIHGEMRAIQATLGVPGELSDFFDHVRAKPELTLADTDDGRGAYLELARGYVAGFDARLDEVFATRPAASLEVKAVEAWRERSAGKAFYQRGTVDGSRPGVFYANLAEMSDMPTYQLQALVYHEGIPGHHMQLSIAQELTDIPAFRRHMRVTAWSEGWGLYSEWLPAEMGLYTDPYSDFGRLAMELWRAGRLVVDTGLHHKRWTREQAIAWLVENTPNPEGDAVNAVERYIVWPGQATAYKIGMLELQRLRREAEAELGDDFDLRAFHDVVLRSGPLPLDVLDAQVQGWVEGQR